MVVEEPGERGKVTLTSSSYSQDCVSRNELRRSLAFSLLQANELESPASMAAGGFDVIDDLD